MAKDSTWLRSLSVAALAALAMTACGGQSAAPATPAATTAAAATVAATAAAEQAESTAVAAEPTEAAETEPTEAAETDTAALGDDPESRVKGFFASITDAVNSPDVKDEAKRKEMAENILSYMAPDERAANESTITEMLNQIGSRDVSQLLGGQNLDVKLHFVFAVTKTKLVEETADAAKVEMLEANMKMELTGKDVDKLGETAKALSQEQSILSSDTEKNIVSLKKIDGVWYLNSFPGK